jgi:hypothetical protein
MWLGVASSVSEPREPEIVGSKSRGRRDEICSCFADPGGGEGEGRRNPPATDGTVHSKIAATIGGQRLRVSGTIVSKTLSKRVRGGVTPVAVRSCHDPAAASLAASWRTDRNSTPAPEPRPRRRSSVSASCSSSTGLGGRRRRARRAGLARRSPWGLCRFAASSAKQLEPVAVGAGDELGRPREVHWLSRLARRRRLGGKAAAAHFGPARDLKGDDGELATRRAAAPCRSRHIGGADWQLVGSPPGTLL